MRCFVIALAFYVIFFEPLFGAVQGRVYTEHGVPLAFPQAEVLASQEWVTGDEWGYFSISEEFLKGERIAIHRIGYRSDTLLISQKKKSLIVHLRPETIYFSSVRVEAQKGAKSTGIRVYSMADATLGSREPSREIAVYLPGITLKQYGGPGSVSTLSMDGGNSQNLTIVYGAIELNSMRNGSVDFSQLPFTGSNQVIYEPSAVSSDLHHGADGILRLSAEISASQLQLSLGSYGHRAMAAGVTFPRKQSRLSASLGYREDQGNYLYQRWRDDAWIERKNNHYQQRFATLNGSGLYSENLWWRMSAMLTKQDRGVPGLSWAILDTSSFREDELLHLGMELGWFSRFGDGKIAISGRQNSEYYENLYYFIYSESQERGQHVAISHHFPLWRRLQAQLYYQIIRGALDSGSTGQQSELRQKAAISIPVTLGKKIVWTPVFFGEHTGSWGASWQSELRGNWLEKRLQMTFLAAQTERRPTLNDRYWQPGGNPELRPEESQSLQFLAQLESHSGDFVFLQLFSKKSDDLIQWMPQAAYWSPANIQEVSRRGFKAGGAFLLLQTLQLRFSYSYLESIDLALKKPLRYAPKHQLRLHAIFQWRNLMLNGDFFSQSRRIFMYNYPEDIQDEGIQTLDIAASWRHSGKWSEQTLTFTVRNLLEYRYESVLGYPEAGREWRINLRINQKGETE